MKKTRILSLVLALCMILAGCGGGSGTETQPSAAPAEPQPSAAPAETPTEALEEKTVSLGQLEGNTYTNHYAGFGFSLDENWVIYPADQLQALPENMESWFDGTALESQELTNIIDFSAENVNDLTTMNMNYTKLTMQERLAYVMMDDEDLIDTMLSEYGDTLKTAYSNAGIEVESIGKKTVTFLGETRCAMHTVASVEDVPYYILQIYDYGLGAYGITLTAASYIEDNTEGLLELYYPVK